MNPNETQTPAVPQTPQEPMASPVIPQTPEEHKGIGPIVGTIIIVAILIAGAFYFWNMYLKTPAPVPEVPAETTASERDSVVSNLKKVGTSDEVSSIETDLQNSNLDNLDAELNAAATNL